MTRELMLARGYRQLARWIELRTTAGDDGGYHVANAMVEALERTLADEAAAPPARDDD